jgi:hypothetical protein
MKAVPVTGRFEIAPPRCLMAAGLVENRSRRRYQKDRQTQPILTAIKRIWLAGDNRFAGGPPGDRLKWA